MDNKGEKMNKEIVDEIKDEKNVNDEKDDEKKDEYDVTMKNGNKQNVVFKKDTLKLRVKMRVVLYPVMKVQVI